MSIYKYPRYSRRNDMKKSIFVSVVFAVLFVIMWSIFFGYYGVWVGFYLGIAIFLLGTLVFKPLDKDRK